MELADLLGFLQPILVFLGEKYGIVGTVFGYLVLVVAPIVTALMPLLELIASLTATKKDDAIMAKVRKVVEALLPVLKVLPHMDVTPLAKKIVEYTKKGAGIAMKIVDALKGLFK